MMKDKKSRQDRPPLYKSFFIPCILILLYLSTSVFRLALTRGLEHYDPEDETGLFYTESAVHYYYARMVARGEGIPSHDSRLQYPEGIEPPRKLTQAQSLAAGIGFRMVRLILPRLRFHNCVLFFTAFFSSLSIFFIYGLSRIIWKSRFFALCSAAMSAATLACYLRLIGHFGRESFAVPWMLGSLYFFFFSIESMQGKRRVLKKYALLTGAAICVFISLWSWHFASFFYLLFVLYISLEYLLDPGHENEVCRMFPWMGGAALAAALVLPVLREKRFLLSPALGFTFLLIIINLFKMRRKSHARFLFVAGSVGMMILFFFIQSFAPHGKEFANVYGLFFSKIRYFLSKPWDPNVLSFTIRTTWVEGFESPSFYYAISTFPFLLPLGILSMAFSLKELYRGKIDSCERMVLFFALSFLVLYIMARRLAPMLALFLSILLIRLAIPSRKGITRKNILSSRFKIAIFLILPILLESRETLLFGKRITFIKRLFQDPSEKQGKILYNSLWQNRRVCDFIRAGTSGDDAICASMGLSGYLVAWTNRPVILHSKYDTLDIREKYREFLYSLYDTEEHFYQFMKKYKGRYFIYEPAMILDATREGYRYMAGKREMPSGSAAFLFHFFPEKLCCFSPAFQSDYFRIFRVKDDDAITSPCPVFPDHPSFSLSTFAPAGKEKSWDDEIALESWNRIRRTLARLDQAAVMLKENPMDKAIPSLINEAEMVFPELPGIPLLRGKYQLLRLQFRRSGKNLDLAVQKDPWNAEAQFLLSEAALQSGRFEKSRNALEKAFRLAPWNKIIENALDRFDSQRERKKADLIKVRDFVSQGEEQARTGDFEKAARSFNKALAINPDDKRALQNLANLAKWNKEYKKARTLFKKALDHDPDDPLLYNGLGISYRALGNLIEAEKAFRKALEIDTDNVHARNNLGTVFAMRKDYESARREFTKVLEDHPDHPDARKNLEKLDKLLGR